MLIDTAPYLLGFDDSMAPCPGSVTLDAAPQQIAVFLYDQFLTPVQGQYLVQFPTDVKMSYTSDVITISVGNKVDNFVQDVTPASGSAIFTSLHFTGPNNSTVALKFTSNSSIPSSVLSVLPVSCSVLLLGCHDGYTVESSGDTSPATCVEGLLHIQRVKILHFKYRRE